MTSLLFGVTLSALLSLTSLLVVLLRVSPLASPAQAIPAFFISLFLTVGSFGSLFFYVLWKLLPFHGWDAGRTLGISVRQGMLLAGMVTMLLLFHLLHLLTWWIALLILAVFVLVESALHV